MLPEKGPTKPSEHTLVILPQKVRLDPKATDSQNVVPNSEPSPMLEKTPRHGMI